MHAYVAFLRGMNLGRRRVKNADLVACFEEAGFKRVSAFLASGNVVFRTGDPDPGRVATHIEGSLEAALGYAVPTFLRTAQAVRDIAAFEPFPGVETVAEAEAEAVAEAGAPAGKLQVALLQQAPTKAVALKLAGYATDDDLLAIQGAELYWLPKGPLTQSELDVRMVQELLGPMTVRTHRTLARLAARFLTSPAS